VPAALVPRLGGRLLDVLLIAWVSAFVVVELLGRLLGGDPLGRRPVSDLTVLDGRAVLALLGVLAALEVVPVARRGASLGKVALGVRVVRTDTWGPPGALRSALRAGALFGPLAVPVVGPFLVVAVVTPAVLWPTRRGLHDLLAGTAVIEAVRP